MNLHPFIGGALAAAFASIPMGKRPGVPDNIAFGRYRRRGLVVSRATTPTKGVIPGGEPGRPFQRMLKRAYAEDLARRTAPKARALVVASLTHPAARPVGKWPRHRKPEGGTLAKLKDRGPQRLGHLCALPEWVLPDDLLAMKHRHASAT